MATTQTQTHSHAPPVSVARHKDSMRATWQAADPTSWNFYQRTLVKLKVYQVDQAKSVPRHDKTVKTPHLAQWSQHVFILYHALLPLFLHELFVAVTGYQIHVFWLVNLYLFAINAIIIKQIKMLIRLGRRHGHLDGDVHARDGVPDGAAGKIFWSLYKTTGSRLAAMAWLSYSAADGPPSAFTRSWTWWAWLVLQIGLYQVVVDFFFYVYHRSMHDVPFLWRFHRTHHLTKHPNPLLSAYADGEQEVIEMLLVPLLTYGTFRAVGIPFGFYEWWICLNYVMYTEVWGHSGVRVHLVVPSTFAWLLELMDMELCIEDHDLHHRKGWRKSHNYGKQTRVWDRLFGTCGARLESYAENVDYVNQAVMPLF